jgi:hypothetical protein
MFFKIIFWSSFVLAFLYLGNASKKVDDQNELAIKSKSCVNGAKTYISPVTHKDITCE